MAATNFTPIQLYFSTTASAAPTAANLAQGELAINITDGKLYYEDGSGVVQVIATKGAGTIGGSTTQIQYNNAGALAGNAAMVFDSGTNTTTLTTLNLTNALGAIYGGTAQSTYAQGDIVYASATNTLSKLGIGTVNYILTSSGSVPQWVAPSSIAVLTATNLAGGVAGSVPYQSGVATTTFLAIGTANRVMTSSGTAPQWVTSLTGLTGVSSSSITNTGLTAGRVVISSTAGLESDSANLTFDGTTLSTTGLSNTGFSTLVKTLTLGNSSFNGTAVFAAATPAKLYMGTGTVTDVTSAISATNTTGAIASLAITPIAATNTGVTYTNASTLYIAGAPSAGTNITITNPYSLYVAAGAVNLGGNTAVTGTLSATGSISLLTNATYFQSVTASSASVRMLGINASNTAYIGPIDAGPTSAEFNASSTSLTATINTAGVARGVFSATGLAVTGTLSSTLGATIQGLTVGLGAGAVSTNTAVGASALAANTTGQYNTVFGNGTGNAITTSQQNSFFGYQSGFKTTGGDNTGSGSLALYNNTSGGQNTAIGRSALESNTTASNNTAVGYQAGYTNTTGTGLTAVGRYALLGNTTGDYNTAFGLNALQVNTTGASNTSMGVDSMRFNTTGGTNVAIGRDALFSNTTASNNTAVGYQAGYANTTGTGNTFLGTQAGFAVTTSNGQTFIGSGAGAAKTTGGNNTFVGTSAGGSATTGTGNTFIGVNDATNGSGFAVTTGSKNTIIGGYTGNQGGLDIRTSDNYIVLSDGDGNPRAYWNGAAATFNGGLAVTGLLTSTDYITASLGTTGQCFFGKGTSLTSGAGANDSSIRWEGASGNLLFSASNVEKMRLDSSGNLTVNAGNIIQGTAAKGINFTANTATAGSTSQLLNWYEEGTWTPVIADATSGGNLASVGTTAARYTRIGRTVFVQASFDNITTTGMTAINNVSIRGLPFASAAGLTATGTCVMNRVSYAFNGWRPQIDPSVSLVQFTEFSAINANYTTMTVANILATTSDIYFSITYTI